MSNSDNIQSLFSSFQFHDSPFIQFYNHAQNPSNSKDEEQDQEYPPFLISSNSPSVIDEPQKFPNPAIHGDVVDEENGNKKKSIYQLRKPCEVKPTRKRNHAPVSRRTGKKGRHSKICTAQGVRDRRMRLSIPTARKFFDLQDLLGFDKPSNTIEWLFSNSQKALEELQRKKNPQGTDGCSFEEDNEQKFISVDENPNNENGITKSRKHLNNHDHVKKSRERARARARARTRARAREITREKMKIKGIKQFYKSTPNKDDLDHSGHSYPFEDHSSHTQNAGGLREKDSNSSSFMGILMDSYAYNSSIFSTIGLVTGKGNPISTCCIPNRKFPFLLQ